MSDMDDIVKEFLVESSEGLDTLDRNLVALEQNPGDKNLLAGIFRCIHTIKGTSGFLGFGRLESVTHVGESLLSDLRDGKKTLTPEITSALLQLVDAVRSMLSAVESTGTDGQEGFASLVELLTRLQKGEPAASGKAEGASRAKGGRKSGPQAAPVAEVPPPAAVAPPVPAQVPEPVPAPAAQVAPVAAAEPAEVKAPAASDSNIRVDVGLLDKLMNLVGELVLARNQILQYTTTADDSGFVATSQRLNLITTELQEGVMKTRMQPIGNVWAKFPRVVRDLALACKKQVRIEMEGKETELDKTIIEAIKDPLTHIVRNSVDHGMELPAERVARGKPAEGRLLLRAYHEGGQVNIEISDDGGGVNTERVKAKAIQKGVITAEQAARMGDRELVNLIFAPGFSTAEQVSNISGRGVGMDVVKTNIEKIGGTVDVQSVAGQGTTLKIKIPLTLAIIPALVVTTAGDRFAIPQVSLLELVRLEGDEAEAGIEMVYGAPVYRLRGRLLPLVNLAHALGLQEGFRSTGAQEAVNIVVLQADEHTFGLVVDEINDTEEIVVKPLGKQLKGIGAFAGATIMGDGRVALILDVLGLGQLAQVVTESARKAPGAVVEAARAGEAERLMLLLFRLGAERRMAIPLSMVARLEEFPQGTIERAGAYQVVQYRGRLLPLIRLTELLGEPGGAEERDPLQVVVYRHEGRDVGLVVENIVDIVEEQLTVHRRERQGAVYGTAVIQQKVTDLLDVRALIEQADVLLFAGSDAEPVGAGV
ncbi:MAG: chemotaxis protein CheW [Gemmatimonadetes bacterium]|nr:chemotaxis protein CheW [Gemmatimonadota bacterium]MBP9199704.1 chemotaxis protein CheW [Gemmatimonadales bacterium]MBK7714939.1 chemotaxis protein CheW [Gemmatimonadota bacterium]MBK7924931.1 chemotaxis protein CheW [Gemmatimonadota bacterium]MBK9067953.1 chemotaxis protein CheW [Gemmatimonadota bacterium]